MRLLSIAFLIICFFVFSNCGDNSAGGKKAPSYVTEKESWIKKPMKEWKMYPKNNTEDEVLLGGIINEDVHEDLQTVPVEQDWLLLRIMQKSANIQPLEFREALLTEGEEVFIIGWRYSDNNCAQRIYEGNVVEALQGSIIISTKLLAHNKIPGLSGSPVIDSGGRLIGIMSQKYGDMERLSSTLYPKQFLEKEHNSIE